MFFRCCFQFTEERRVEFPSTDGLSQEELNEIEANENPKRKTTLKEVKLPISNGSVVVSNKQLPSNFIMEGVDQDESLRQMDPNEEVNKKRIVLARTLMQGEDDWEGKKIYRILFVGIADSGKSTLVKHLKLLGRDKPEWTAEEKEMYHHVILSNILSGIRTLILYMELLNISYGDLKNKRLKSIFEDMFDSNSLQSDFYDEETGTSGLAKVIQQFYRDEGVQQCLKRGNEFNLLKSLEYFLLHIERILSSDYMPTHEDILNCRSSTISIFRDHFKADQNSIIKIQDLGGYIYQRANWTPFLSSTGPATEADASMIVYVHSLTSFLEPLEENTRMISFFESLKAFQEVAQKSMEHPNATKIPLVLILNKKDLLEHYLQTKNIQIQEIFSDFEGKLTVDSFIQYTKQKFIHKNPFPQRPFYIYITQGTDPEKPKLLMRLLVHLLLVQSRATSLASKTL